MVRVNFFKVKVRVNVRVEVGQGLRVFGRYFPPPRVVDRLHARRGAHKK